MRLFVMMTFLIVLGVILVVLVVLVIGVAIYDVTQRKHAILHNFPIVGHFRYILECVGPELRQYIVTGNDEERPFSRDQRRWVYASSKQENSYFGFGTDNGVKLRAGYHNRRQNRKGHQFEITGSWSTIS